MICRIDHRSRYALLPDLGLRAAAFRSWRNNTVDHGCAGILWRGYCGISWLVDTRPGFGVSTDGSLIFPVDKCASYGLAHDAVLPLPFPVVDKDKDVLSAPTYDPAISTFDSDPHRPA